MNIRLIQEIHQQNPWLQDLHHPICSTAFFRPRVQLPMLMQREWDTLWTLLLGPRRAGKTTLGKHLSAKLIAHKHYNQLLYLNCDLLSIREWLKTPLFLEEALIQFRLSSPIIFIDEVQRLDAPGLLLKTIADLARPIKMIASGSSQLEIKSKVQEHLTGRNFSSLVLPLSFNEWDAQDHLDELFIYGAYPQVINSTQKQLLVSQIYQDYINKDIIEFLKIAKPDSLQKLLSIIAHSSGQLANYNQFATDCQLSVATIQHYLNVLQQTYVIDMVTPFVGNKRTELTSNPKLYFLDNGFRNYALRNFSDINSRTDGGLLVEGLVFQEMYKYITQNFLNYTIHYWRTKAGAEVDFVIYKNAENFIPIEVKYRNNLRPTISRGYRSFLQAYQPKNAVVITKDLLAQAVFEQVQVNFIPVAYLKDLFNFIDKL